MALNAHPIRRTVLSWCGTVLAFVIALVFVGAVWHYVLELPTPTVIYYQCR